MPKIELTFRLKLLVALVGLVFLMIALLLLMLQHETSKQIDSAVSAAAERSQLAFRDLEHLWRSELSQQSVRLTASNRLPSALDEALAEDDPEVLVGAANYELRLAGISSSLVVFADPNGRPLTTLLDGQPMPSEIALPPADALIETENQTFGYKLLGERLFAVSLVPLSLFGRAVGSIMLGFPVDQEIATRLGEVVDAEVGFVVDGRLVVSTSGVSGAALESEMEEMGARPSAAVRVLDEPHVALFADLLSAAEPSAGARVLAVPLDQAVAPIERMRQRLWLAGLAALGLAVLLGLFLSRGLSAPVAALIRATDRVAAGELDFGVEVRSSDEMGRLAIAFNQMISGLALKERYRSLLDKVVSREVAEEMLRAGIELGGETRRVSVLFADIRGFTAITEGMEPQGVIALLNEFMDRASSAIEEAGGVVDKYVGDQIMGVFGAPVAHGDDAERAVRAALGIRGAMAELNRDRLARGVAPILLGIGINTGLAVAGNMGSRDRLNYTVLGESVNLAARLCSSAVAGEILLSEATFDEVTPDVTVSSPKPITVKGLSYPVKVYAVAEAQPGDEAPQTRASGSAALLTLLLVSILGSVGLPAAGAGNPLPDVPTLAQLGAGYRSPSGVFQLDLSGRLQLDGYVPDDEPAWLIPETDSFLAGELSLFVDVFAGDHVYGLVELRADRGEAPAAGNVGFRVEQAFLRITPWRDLDLGLQLGRFVSPFGGYPQRHDSVADPFIRPPLPYDYRTMICPGVAPSNTDRFLYWRHVPELFRSTGAPVVWDAPYQVGLMVLGSSGAFSYRLAMMGSAPSSEPEEWNYRPYKEYDPSWVAHLGVQASPSLRVGLSYNRGPYSQSEIEPQLPPGASINDFLQEIWGLEVSFTRGFTELRGELFWDRWDVPSVVRDPRDLSYYVEIKQKLSAGLFAALRYGAIRFNELPGSSGVYEPWDYDMDRWQLGAGYRLNRAMELRGEYMWNLSSAPTEPADDLLSLRLRWEF